MIVALLLLCTVVAGCGRRRSEESMAPVVRIFAAASLGDVLQDMIESDAAPAGITIQLNVAASGTLARQIESGAPCDIVISADQQWMDYLQRRHLIDPESRRDLLGNSLALIVAANATTRSFAAWDDVSATLFVDERIAIADPELVPAGRYARQALEHLGLWSALQDQLLPAADVRAALRLVETGEATFGIVYASDAATATWAVLLATFPSASHDPIRYPIALVGEASPAAHDVMNWLLMAETAERLRSCGFQPLTTASP